MRCAKEARSVVGRRPSKNSQVKSEKERSRDFQKKTPAHSLCSVLVWLSWDAARTGHRGACERG